MNTVRVALPGYNALTDTNLDHFALYTDEGDDNVLIKEKTRGEVTLASGASQDITHNLGYIPFFMVFVNETGISSDTWSYVGTGTSINALYVAASDTSKVTILNNSFNTRTFKYFLFYDKQVGSASVSITESENVFKVAKQGMDALTSRDPNDYIFHSDLNTFKIVYQGKTSITVTTAPQNSQFAHNSPLSSTSCIFMVAQFPDGKATLVSWYGSNANSTKEFSNLQGLNGHAFDGAYFDNTNIYVPNTGGTPVAYQVTFVWYIFEADL